MSKATGMADKERYQDDYWDQHGYKDEEEWLYNYDLLAFKVDTMNEKLNRGQTLPIQYIFDDMDIPKHKRIKLLNDMINSLAIEIGESVANGEFPELKKMFDR